MTRTKHFQSRFGQRGFSEFTLDMVLKCGRVENANKGATKIFFGKKEKIRLIQEAKKVIQLIDKADGATLILEGDNLITIYKRHLT